MLIHRYLSKISHGKKKFSPSNRNSTRDWPGNLIRDFLRHSTSDSFENGSRIFFNNFSRDCSRNSIMDFNENFTRARSKDSTRDFSKNSNQKPSGIPQEMLQTNSKKKLHPHVSTTNFFRDFACNFLRVRPGYPPGFCYGIFNKFFYKFRQCFLQRLFSGILERTLQGIRSGFFFSEITLSIFHESRRGFLKQFIHQFHPVSLASFFSKEFAKNYLRKVRSEIYLGFSPGNS